MLYRSLGNSLVTSAPEEDIQLDCLNNVWRAVMKLKNPDVSISTTFSWCVFPTNFRGGQNYNFVVKKLHG